MRHIRTVLSVGVLFVFPFVLPSLVHAWPTKVVNVADGVTFTVLRNNNQQVKNSMVPSRLVCPVHSVQPVSKRQLMPFDSNRPMQNQIFLQTRSMKRVKIFV